MSRVGKRPRGITAPPQMPAVIRGAPKRSAEDHCATLAGREADGSNGGHLEGVWRAPRGSILRANLHNSTIERICAGLAVLCVPYMRSTARPRGIGPIVELCMLRRAATPSRDDRTHPQVPAVIPERRDPAPGEPTPHLRRPPLKTQSAPRPPRNQGPPPPGTDARRNGLPAWPARHPASPRPGQPGVIRLDAERSEAPKTSRRGARPCGTRRRSPSPPGP